MLRIQRSENGRVVFTLSGQMDEEAIAEVERLINSETTGRRITLDLRNVTLVNENAITFLVRCEANGIRLKNCPPYVREWINAQRRES
jgi:anti-anti-sigma regulatory factor